VQRAAVRPLIGGVTVPGAQTRLSGPDETS
jgi:hypothetical protein